MHASTNRVKLVTERPKAFSPIHRAKLFITSDVSQFWHGPVHVRWVATLNGPKKNLVPFTLNLTQAINAARSFVQLDIAQRLPVVQKVALGTIVG
jgi:hypothetical protein